MAEAGFFTRIGERADQFRESLSRRFNTAKDNLVNRFNGIKTEAKTRLMEVVTRVAVWGFEHLVEPHQQRIVEILTIPALFTERQARGAMNQALINESLAELEGKDGPQDNQESEWRRAENIRLKGISQRARGRAAELRDKAARQRGKVKNKFSKARAFVAVYNTGDDI